MKPRIILGLALVLIGLPANCFGATDTTQAQLERMARTCTHFSLKVIIRNQRLWSVGRDLDLEQVFLAGDLRVLSPEREALASLLKHSDPRVRTLALGALFEREDGRDLPLIATLVNDEGATFPDLFDSTSGEGGPRPMSELESPQTVGQVAKAMLRFWMVPEDMSSFVEKETFSDYWKRHADRDHYASWFAVKMKRATRQSVPIEPEYLPDIQRVLAEMKALPMPDRAWTQLYVLAPGGWNEFEKEDLVAQDEELIAMIKELSPESLLHFLQRQKISDDPDLLMDKDNPEFIRMSNFILRHADQLLRPEDSDALLACEYVEHDSGGINPAWAIGAALVQPARASKILHNALAHEARTYETAAGMLAGALWRIRGTAEMDFLVDWFYATQPTVTEPLHQPVAFLWEVKAAARPDTKQLFAALVKDPRFGHTDWNTLQEILSIVNASRPTPLVKERDIYAAQPNGLLDERMILPVWRNLLRREYDLPEQPLPSPAAVPNQVLTQPAWSVPLAKPPSPTASLSQIVPSSDGKWLAMLTEGTINICKADTGEFWWKIPHDPRAAALCMAFETDGQRLMVFDRANYGRFSEWNIITRQQIGQVLLTGKPSGAVDQGAYSLDGEALHAVFAGYDDLTCFDTHSGKPFWLNPRKGSVHSLVAMSWDGTLLAVRGGLENPQVVNMYDVASGKLLQQIGPLTSPALALALSRDGRNLATATTADGIQLWDTATGNLLKKYAYQVPGWGMSAPVFSPDGRWLAVERSSTDPDSNRVGVFRTDSADLEWEIQVKSDAASGFGIPLAFAPNGKTLYTGTYRLEAWRLQ